MTRPAPHDREAEKAILGGIVLDNEALAAADSLTPADFFVGAHRLIFGAMRDLADAGEPIDAVTLGARLGDRLDDAGGSELLFSLVDGLPRAVNVESYSRIVAGLARRREIARICAEAAEAAMDGGADPAAVRDSTLEKLAAIDANGSDGLYLVNAASVEIRRVEWAWRDALPLGGLSLLVGDPGLGKTTLAVDLAARVTRGQLDGDLRGEPSSVVIATVEDAMFVLRGRLEAAGADVLRVEFVRVRKDGLDGGLTLPDDVHRMERKASGVGAKLVVIDPVSGHLGGAVDSHRDASLRKALAPLARMAETVGAAALGIAHLNKTSQSNIFRRVGGSIGLTAAARSILLLAEDEESGELILVHGKSNLGPLVGAQRLRVEPREIVDADGATVPTSAIAWLGDAPGVSVTDVLDPQAREDHNEVEEFLVDFLRANGGEAPAKACTDAGKEAGFSPRTMRRARKNSSVQAKKAGFSSGWVWFLPEEAGPEPRDKDVAPSAPSRERGESEEGAEGAMRPLRAPSVKSTLLPEEAEGATHVSPRARAREDELRERRRDLERRSREVEL